MTSEKAESSIEIRLKELYQLSKSGDQKAYKDFLLASSEVINRFLKFIDKGGKLNSQLDDLHQEILYKIHSKKHTYREDRPIVPWIHAIIRYAYIDQYRKLQGNPEVESVHDVREVEKEDTDGLNEILDLLTQDQRNLIQAISLDGKTFSEVAKEMNIRESTLRVRFHRLINELKARNIS